MAVLALLWIAMFGAAFTLRDPPPVATRRCPSPNLVDHTGLGFDDTLGRMTIDNATRTCDTRYRGCLVRLVRMQETAFHAVCRRTR